MRRTIAILFIAISTLLIVSCADSGTETEEPIPHDFTTAPSEELNQTIEETPSDFTWGFFNDNIEITLHDDPQWSGELVISGFQVQNGEIVNNMTSAVIETNADELAEGLSTEELFSGEIWFPGEMWVSTEEMNPGENWFPGEMWMATEIEEVAMSQNDLAEDQALVVIYAHVPLESVEREQVTRPFGIVFQQHQPPAAQTKLSNKIIYESNEYDSQEIFIMDENGSNTERLTDDSHDNMNPVISKDGTRITFISNRNTSNAEGVDLFVMNADGSEIELLDDISSFQGFYSWSPDNSQIVYDDRVNGNNNIFRINSDGTERTQLTDNSFDDIKPSWSPGGDRIAFTSDPDDDLEFDIYTMNTDGEDIQQITDTDTDSESHQPRWSPDGSKIVFVSDRNGIWDRIYTYNLENDNIQQITSQSSEDSDQRLPSWSPDGSYIIYQTAGEIYKVASDGSGTPEQLTNTSGYNAEAPFWSPVQ